MYDDNVLGTGEKARHIAKYFHTRLHSNSIFFSIPMESFKKKTVYAQMAVADACIFHEKFFWPLSYTNLDQNVVVFFYPRHMTF